MTNKNLSSIFVAPSDSIKKTLDVLAANKSNKTGVPGGIVLVVSKDKILQGIATDGDIRRALSKSTNFKIAISRVMNKKPFIIEGPKNSMEVLSLAIDKIRRESWHKDRLNKIIIVDKDRRVLDLVSFYDLWHKSDVRFKQIGVVGLGYVGLTLAVTLAELGFKVRGYDSNREVMASLKKGKAHFYENGLQQMLKDTLRRNFEVTRNFHGTDNCDVYFIAVGTPLDKQKKPELRFIKSAAQQIGRVLKNGDLVVLRSTVPLGTTRNFVVPILEKESGLKVGDDFFLAFAPERTIEGKALEELRKLPQVIGGINRVSTDLAATIFGHMTHSTVMVDSLEEAEIVKLINNTYRDVTFSFANELALVCNRFGIDTHRVIEAANRGYERSNVPLPSPGVGGACLEKDPFIFIESAKTKNYAPLLAQHARVVSDMMVNFVAGEVIDFASRRKADVKNPKILILGLAFKGQPATSDVRGSTAVALIKQLQKAKLDNIHVYDPVVSASAFAAHGVKRVADIANGFNGADAAVIMNNNLAFADLDMRSLLRRAGKPVLLFDPWGLQKKNEIEKVRGAVYKKI